MNGQELFLADGKSAGVFYCAKCQLVRKTKNEADDCCSPYKCQHCGKETERYHTICNSCQERKEIAAEAARFDKAEKLTSFDGQIFSDDKFYQSIEDMLDDITGDPPEYVWATTQCHFVYLDIDKVIESAVDIDGAYEDFDQEPDGFVELKVAIDAFNKANYHHISYMPDYTKSVLIALEKRNESN